MLIANYGEDDIYTKECEIVQTDKYSLRITEYDALGNIKNLIRQGLKDPYAEIPEYGTIDMLHYDYDPNSSSLLTAIEETSCTLRGYQGSGSAYAYTNTGNLKSDSEKGIQDIIYSYNDLPLKIETNEGNILNWYTSDGLKVKSTIIAPPNSNQPSVAPEVRNYIGAAEYKDNTIEAIYTDEGRVTYPKSENPYIEYHLKDHLGNTRSRIADINGDNLVLIDPNDPDKDELMNISHSDSNGRRPQWMRMGIRWNLARLKIGILKMGKSSKMT
ncbi:MAG: hypothetical protein AAGA77_17160 [Bacteroidota bacterium]